MLGHALIAAVLALVGVSLLITPWSSANGGEASASGPLRWAGVACVVVAAIFFGIGFVCRSATEMAVTNKRVIVKSGLANRRRGACAGKAPGLRNSNRQGHGWHARSFSADCPALGIQRASPAPDRRGTKAHLSDFVLPWARW